MTDTGEPRTAEEWVVWASENTRHAYLAPSTVLEAIRRAQEQARREAIEECAKIAQENGYTYSHHPLQPWAEDLNIKLRAQRKYIADKIRELLNNK